ncbi:tail fiber assembly protein [Escherichia coli]
MSNILTIKPGNPDLFHAEATPHGVNIMTVDPRQHDLSDAFAIVGPQSQAQKISGISTSAAQLRTDDGAAFVEVAAGHNITIKTPGQLTATAEGGTTITSPTITLNGNVTINGNLSQGMGESGGTATMLGPVATEEEVVALAEWKKYRVLLMRVDISTAPDIVWPPVPT